MDLWRNDTVRRRGRVSNRNKMLPLCSVLPYWKHVGITSPPHTIHYQINGQSIGGVPKEGDTKCSFPIPAKFSLPIFSPIPQLTPTCYGVCRRRICSGWIVESGLKMVPCVFWTPIEHLRREQEGYSGKMTMGNTLTNPAFLWVALGCCIHDTKRKICMALHCSMHSDTCNLTSLEICWEKYWQHPRH